MYKTFYLQTDKQLLSKEDIISKGIAFCIKNWLAAVAVVGICICLLRLFKVADINYFKSNIPKAFDIRHQPLYFFFISVILYPMIEELTFRLGTNLQKKNIIISLSFLLLVMIDLFTGYHYSDKLQYKLPICLCWALLLYSIPEKYFQIKKRWKKGIAVYAITITFALMHMKNYSFHISYLPIYCILCLPQFVMGVTSVYFRLNLGFLYGYGCHAFINLIVFFFMFAYCFI